MPLRFLADENFDRRVTSALIRQLPSVDVVRVQDVGLRGCDDPGVLEWAAGAGRVLLTHDRKTMPGFAMTRVAAGEPMPGVFLVSTAGSLHEVIDALLVYDGASQPEEYEGMIVAIP